jgi:hypothetical protein
MQYRDACVHASTTEHSDHASTRDAHVAWVQIAQREFVYLSCMVALSKRQATPFPPWRRGCLSTNFAVSQTIPSYQFLSSQHSDYR